jgi:1-pyrroline-5-carboxylate dehydrogenase
MLWQKISNNLDTYKSYPRIVGETGGKNMHFLHSSADAHHAALQTIRGAFEYSGQKCSATSRVYVPDSLWPKFKESIVNEHAKFKLGPAHDFGSHGSAVINQASYKKITSFIEDVKSGKDSKTKILAGGNGTIIWRRYLFRV